MSKCFVWFLVCAFLAASVMMAGCSNSQQAVSLVGNKGEGIALLKLTTSANSPFSKIARSATLTISASDILTMVKTLTVTDSSVEGTITGIPAGKNRHFYVAVYDSLDTLQYSGSTTANVIADSMVTISITVARVTGGAIINGSIVESDTGLVAYYPFNGNANDESGNGYNATVSGATLTTDRFGNANSAYYFSGSGDSIVVTIPTLPIDSQPRTISAFVKADSLGGVDQYIVGWGGTPSVAGSTWYLDIYQSLYRLVNAIEEPRAGTVENGKWVHFAATYDGDTAKVYLNGSLIAITGKITLLTNNNILLFGKYPNEPGMDFKGAIDDVRIYNRALSDAEIYTIFHEGGWTGN